MPPRTPPHDLEAEGRLLASVLLRPRLLPSVVAAGVEESVWYEARHRAAWRAIVDLDASASPIDPVTVASRLGDVDGGRYAKDGEGWLTGLMLDTPSAEAWQHWALRVVSLAHLRRLLTLCAEVAGEAYATQPEQARELIGRSLSRLMSLSMAAQGASGPRAVAEIVPPVLAELAERTLGRVRTPHCSWSFVSLDALAPITVSDFVLLAARPSVGKTATILRVLARCGVPALLFSLEMRDRPLVQRMLHAESRVSADVARAGNLSGADMAALMDAGERLSGAPVWIYDRPLKLGQLRAHALRWRSEHSGPAVVAVDYLQLVLPDRRDPSAEREVAELTRGLKSLTGELGCPVIALSQLSRRVEQREDSRPKLSDLRGSGALEQDADLVVFLHREEGKASELEVIVAKQRNGPTGVRHLRFYGATQAFEEA